MKKVNERFDDISGCIRKEYELDESLKEFYEQLKNSDVDTKRVYLNEDVEADMKNVSGTCDIDYLNENYDKIIGESSDLGAFSISLVGKYNDAEYVIRTYPKNNNNVYLFTDESSVELPNMMVKKNEQGLGISK